MHPKFNVRPLNRSLAELQFLAKCGAEQVAFYDDALLYRAGQILKPFLIETLRRDLSVNFHTPNALNARFITPELADLMVRAGFKSFYLGFESTAFSWQKKTGGKVRMNLRGPWKISFAPAPIPASSMPILSSAIPTAMNKRLRAPCITPMGSVSV
jgi:hypothetical protein